MFTVALLMVILTLSLARVAKLMTHQHHIDDSLADATLASFVADDVYYFEIKEMTGILVIRFLSVEESHRIFMDCINEAITDTNGFYYNFAFDEYICYEVEDGNVKITSYQMVGNEIFQDCDKGTWNMNGKSYIIWLGDYGYNPLYKDSFIQRIPYYFYHWDGSSDKNCGTLHDLFHKCLGADVKNPDALEEFYQDLIYVFYDKQIPLYELFD